MRLLEVENEPKQKSGSADCPFMGEATSKVAFGPISAGGGVTGATVVNTKMCESLRLEP